MKIYLLKYYCYLLIVFLVGGYKCYAQNTMNTNLFDSVQDVAQRLPSKINLVYSFVTWCGGEPESILAIKHTLLSNRDKYNLICIVDTNQGIYHKYFDDLKPDAILKFNDFYPKCLKSRKEQKYALAEYNKTFGLVDEYYGGGSGLFILDSKGLFINRVYLANREAHLQLFINYLKPN